MNECDIFIAARHIASGDDRVRYLVEACGGDVRLHHRIENLLHSEEEAESFLQFPVVAEYSPADDYPLNEAPGSVIGPYRLLEQIGEGGMGTVYKAEQTQPVARRVALKIIKVGMDTRQVIARFEAERQALALMDHPNIARVLDAGATDAGRPYFVMELVTGVPITAYCDLHDLTPCARLELFLPICQAVQHAHQKGIIHRDLKPSNILVAHYDDQVVPKIIDFGVAKAITRRLTEKTMFTQCGQIVGTIDYMSPEQAEFKQLDVDTRSDIYSLGVVLYELLTGETPFDKERLRAAPFDELLRIIREEEPPRPSTRLSSHTNTAPAVAARRRTGPKKLSLLIQGELDWIVMKALEKDRSRRYATAGELAADITHYLRDEPVTACPPSAAYRFRKFARRNKVALATSSVVAAAILIAVAVLASSSVLVSRALDAETVAKDSLKGALERERRDSYFHRIALADRELAANDLGRALRLLDECPADLREWEWHYLMRLCRVEPLIVQGSTEFNAVTFSPDGEQLAAAGGNGEISLWDSRTGRLQQSFAAHPGYVSCVAFHPDGRHLASVGADRQVRVWNLSNGTAVFVRPCDAVHVYGATRTVAFSPDGSQLAAGNEGVVSLWDWRQNACVCELPGHEKTRLCVAFSPDGRMATGSWWGTTRLWNLSTGGELQHTLADNQPSHHPVSALDFDATGERLAGSRYDRRIDLWDTRTGTHVQTLPHAGLVLSVGYSPDGRRLASAGEDKTVRIWDAATGREVLDLRGHNGMCCCVAFSPDGQRLATAGKDRTIRLWDAAPLQGTEGQEVLTFAGHRNEIWTLSLSADGRSAASGGFSTSTMVWDIQSGQVLTEFDGHREIEFCVAWDPRSDKIASAGGDGATFSVKVWNARTGQEAFTIPTEASERSEYFAVAFSPDGEYLVTGSADKSLRVWHADTGAAVCILGHHDRMIRGVLFSRDGRQLASVSDDGIVQLWDATRLQEPQTSNVSVRGRVHGQCLNVAFSPDGSRVATGAEEGTIKTWDSATGSELRTLRGHSGDIYAVAFSPDPEGRWIASAGEDSTVRIWDSQTARQIQTFRGHLGLVSSLAFTPDGLHLVSGSRDHTVKVWTVSQFSGQTNP